ncbi:unnamed protein product [Adineta ricciae]|uniref:Uncharacterized protein n=1 Tax=Adineta ricciae TaxID=249248 RepID=A0A814GIM8_ADIRI|nr:unnamed protein product [Adineta ricciae]CAF0996909.1 unnamed protein product [Adineta ricciae]
MSDQPPRPPRPHGPRLSHLHSEPVPMSFASPQQLAYLAAGGSLFPQQPMHTMHQPRMPRMAAPYHTNMGHHPMYRMQTSSSTMMTNDTIFTPAAVPQTAVAAANRQPFKSLPPQEINLTQFTGFKFVTLDGLQEETRGIYYKISNALQWEMCDGQENSCLDAIQNKSKDKRVFLVTSGSLGAKIVPQIHELPQVYAIYVYCADVKRHKEWAKNFSKIRVVCNDDDRELLPQFAVDVARANVDWGDALLKAGTRDKAQEKYQLALNKLAEYSPNHDPTMDVEIKGKLEQCK